MQGQDVEDELFGRFQWHTLWKGPDYQLVTVKYSPPSFLY